MTYNPQEQEHLVIIAKTIRSRFEILETQLSNELTQPSKDGLKALISLTEQDLQAIKEIITSK